MQGIWNQSRHILQALNAPRDVLAALEMDLVYDMKRIARMPLSLQNIEQYLTDIGTYLYEHADLVKIIFRNNSDRDFVQLLNDLYSDIWDEYRDLEQFANIDEEGAKLMVTYFGGGGLFASAAMADGGYPKNTPGNCGPCC